MKRVTKSAIWLVAVSMTAHAAAPQVAEGVDQRVGGLEPVLVRQGGAAVLTKDGFKTVTTDNLPLAVQSGSIVASKMEDPRPVSIDTLGIKGVRLPYQFKVVDRIAGDRIIGTDFHPVVYPRTGLRYFGNLGAFVAELSVGVWEAQPTGPKPIPEPITLALGSTGLDSIDPRDLEFRELNTFADIKVASASLPDTPQISIRPSFDPTGVTIDVPVASRPALRITIPRGEILGLGLEQGIANITVSRVHEPEGMTLDLEIDRGWLDGGRVVLDEHGRATAAFRSVGFGDAEISSPSDVFEHVQTDRVRFAVPWGFVLAVLVGGIVGTIATRSGRTHWGRALAVGVSTGVIVVFAYSVGINLLDVSPTATAGEALAFVLAALGAAAGPRVLGVAGSLESAPE